MYKIKLSQNAAANLKKIDNKTRTQIINKISLLKENPLLLGKPLTGPLKQFRALKAAGQCYRVIYQVMEYEIIVLVVAVGIRKSGDKKDIYELMKKYIKTGLLD